MDLYSHLSHARLWFLSEAANELHWRHECAGNSCNRKENNNGRIVKEASVKHWIHSFERHNSHKISRFTVIIWAIQSNNLWKV